MENAVGFNLADLLLPVNPLARHYSKFRVSERLLLTGHSHQAWPDVSLEAQVLAWSEAAEAVDGKWDRAEQVAEAVREGWRGLLGEPQAELALGQNTHELILRFLSALPLRSRPRLITSDGEFHTLRRQLARLEEEGIAVVRVAARPVETLSERLMAQVDSSTAAVLVSSVLFETAEIVPNLGALAARCLAEGAELLVDTYHQLNVVPLDVPAAGLQSAFVVGGGYKYCQLGEGNCFLRVPARRTFRPVLTGWFAEFGALSRADRPGEVPYPEGAGQFAGATYDPTAHYRARAVFAFQSSMGLTPTLLRQVSVHQVGLLADAFDGLDLPPSLIGRIPVPPARRAGFLALRSSRAAELQAQLKARGLLTDVRGATLRLGPAPYLSDRQLEEAIRLLGECCRDNML